jgi:2-methylcitrate dehydratase PrpD
MSTQALARNIVKTGYPDLPEEVREATKKSILDTLGVMFPPTTLEKSCVSIYELMKEVGGKKESTFIGFGGKAPCWMAAFVNGSLTHSLDYDDSADAGQQPLHHPTGSTFPAALAMAERVGGVSGKDFITAIALGNDLGVRLASCIKGNIMEDFSFFPVTIFGVFTAAAVAGKLLGLSEAEMVNTLGLASHRVAGVKEIIMSIDSDLRAIRDGFTNREGVISALMASRGIAAGKNAIEQILQVYYRGEYDTELLIADLGKRFRGVEASFKLWPACGQTHGYIKAVLQIIKENNIKPDQIEEVWLTGSKSGEALCFPLEVRQKPTSSILAKISLPFVVGVALAKGEVSINHFLPQNLKDPEVLKIAKMVKHVVNPTFGVLFPVQAKIKTKDGNSYSCTVETIRDPKENSSSIEGIIAKFKDCAGYSKKRLSPVKIQGLITAILELEKVDDMREISGLLA